MTIPATPSVAPSKALPVERHALTAEMAAQHHADRRPPGEWPPPASVPVCILVPVKNEEANMAECLRRLQWASQIVVVDSQSIDRTTPISQAFGAEVYQFQFSKSGWPKKKNWALDHVAWKNDWLMMVDADEHITPELAAEIAAVVRAPKFDSYLVKRRFNFMGRWICHCGYYPVWNLRLFRQSLGRYERFGALGDTGSGDNEVHEHVVMPSKESGYLANDMLHYAYPDLYTWVEKHNRYSNWEAHAMLAGNQGGVEPALFGDPIARRRWLKKMTRWLPFRPLWRFLYAYIAQRGFLDGRAGYHFCWMLAWYEYLSNAKYQEMKMQLQEPPPPK